MPKAQWKLTDRGKTAAAAIVDAVLERTGRSATQIQVLELIESRREPANLLPSSMEAVDHVSLDQPTIAAVR